MSMKQMKKDALDITTTSVSLGAMADAGSKIPGANMGGVAALSRAMPTIGAITGAKHSIGMVSKLQPKKKRRKRK